ncbi:MAG TPA: DnaB-like helicase C-terminal domain-containing protein [Actinomycetales bacterium]|nr:DnaB-like helicase C-terminal domain-containing protein [Actinomycetales bacterium]
MKATQDSGGTLGRAVEPVTLLAALQSPEEDSRGTQRSWDTGLYPLDVHLGGGLHAGDLALVAGAQGVGKTTATLQVARNVAAAGGRATYVCYEHLPTTLSHRLLALEAALVAGDVAPSMEELRAALARTSPGETLEDRVGALPGMSMALSSIAEYGQRLTLVAARGDQTGIAELRELVPDDEPGLVVVDYLQKVHVPGVDDEEVRVARVATALKDLALESGSAVLAVAAVEREGLSSPRIRSRHLKGSVTLAYEADVVLVLQDKYDVVARQHLVYDSSAGSAHHRWLVCSVEKNRHGEDRLDMEFRKRLSHGLLDPVGRMVEDQLADERIDVS